MDVLPATIRCESTGTMLVRHRPVSRPSSGVRLGEDPLPRGDDSLPTPWE